MATTDHLGLGLAALLLGALATPVTAQLAGQTGSSTTSGAQPVQEVFLDGASHVLMPQFRGFALREGRREIGVDGIDARVEILEPWRGRRESRGTLRVRSAPHHPPFINSPRPTCQAQRFVV